jgi:hypothetical protein
MMMTALRSYQHGMMTSLCNNQSQPNKQKT